MIDIRDFQGRHVHMIGIGGSSMSGLAEMLLKEGYTVSGSDNANSHAVERLRKAGVPVQVGHRAENVQGADLLVFHARPYPGFRGTALSDPNRHCFLRPVAYSGAEEPIFQAQ